MSVSNVSAAEHAFTPEKVARITAHIRARGLTQVLTTTRSASASEAATS